MDLAYDRADWVPTAAALALIRNNGPLLGYIAGQPAAFTSKDHTFYPGETVEKQAIIINNSRRTVTCDCTWSLGLSPAVTGNRRLEVPTGEQVRIPLSFRLPETTAPGTYEVQARFDFSSGETQNDSFALHVMPRPLAPWIEPTIALYDPPGETTAWLSRLGIPHQTVAADADLSAFEVLVVGKGALRADGPAPDVTRVRDGLRVVVFEQTSDVLEKRFGFRVVEYGLRQVFARIPDHPLLVGIEAEHLRDWRGAATILAPRLKYEMRPRHGPTVNWCDIPVSRLWRCGNRGNVASVLIEKPARGDFLPVLDGGFSLQYSPLMEYRAGRGMILFCQVDVTGRTAADPAAETLVHNVFRYMFAWKPAPSRTALYAGDRAGQEHLESSGIPVESYEAGKLSPGQVLIVGPGGGPKLAPDARALAAWLKDGGNLLAIGLDEQEAGAFLPFEVRTKKAEHISAYFDAPGLSSLLVGAGPADVHNRDPREFPLITGTAGAAPIGDGVLARAEGRNVVFYQLAPWSFGGNMQPNFRKTYRRSSFLLTRLLANLGVAGSTPLLARFHTPVDAMGSEKRWQDGLYLDQPQEWDDPYRFFRW
jgi:hypothetical protein